MACSLVALVKIRKEGDKILRRSEEKSMREVNSLMKMICTRIINSINSKKIQLGM